MILVGRSIKGYNPKANIVFKNELLHWDNRSKLKSPNINTVFLLRKAMDNNESNSSVNRLTGEDSSVTTHNYFIFIIWYDKFNSY